MSIIMYHFFISPMFGKTIPPVPFYSILFKTIQLSNLTNHSIPFHFFLTIFFNFSNPYTISLNLNHLYHLEIHKVKPFNIFFFSNHSKPFFPSQRMEWDGQNGLPKHMVDLMQSLIIPDLDYVKDQRVA